MRCAFLVTRRKLGVVALAVHGVGGDHDVGQRERFQERYERGDLVAFFGDLPLGEHDPGMGDGGDQVRGAGVTNTGASNGLAVHGQARPRWAVTLVGATPGLALARGLGPAACLGAPWWLAPGAGLGLPARALSRQSSLPSGRPGHATAPALAGRCRPGAHRASEGVRARRPDRGRWR